MLRWGRSGKVHTKLLHNQRLAGQLSAIECRLKLVGTENRQMNILIVYAHQESRSFNYAMLETAREILTRKGHEVVVSDLYAMSFTAAATRADFRVPTDPEFFKYSREQYHASTK